MTKAKSDTFDLTFEYHNFFYISVKISKFLCFNNTKRFFTETIFNFINFSGFPQKREKLFSDLLFGEI